VGPGVPENFSVEQKNYLLKYLARVQWRGQVVPREAPFTAAQRELISQLLAQMDP